MFVCVTLLILTGFMKTGSVAESLKVVGPDDTVTAHVGEDVVLPCSLQTKTSVEDMTVSWLKRNMTVHLYERYKDKPEEQAESYRGRTDLFKEELMNGNISLKLSAIQLSDEGMYTCLIESSSGYGHSKVYIKVEDVRKSFPAWKIALISLSPPFVAFIVLLTYIVNRKKIERKFTSVKYSAIAKEIIYSSVRDEFDLKNYNTTEEGYMKLIPAITNCRKARLAGCELSQKLILKLKLALQLENSFLKELDLSNNEGLGLWDLLDGLKSLEVLRLTMCNLNKEACDTVQKVLKSENHLKELDFSYNDLKDEGLEKICDGLMSENCKLKTLRLAECRLTEQACENLGLILQHEKFSLKELDLSYNPLKDSGAEKLCAALMTSHCKLKTLRLAKCELGEPSCNSLKSVLETDQNFYLKELDLSNNDLQGSRVEKLCEGLKSSHCKLETLSLTMCKISEGSCGILATVLNSENNILKHLDLSNNDLEDSGVKKLCVGLKSEHCKLETLCLTGCMIGVEVCTSLASALNSMPTSLKILDLRYNNPGETALKRVSNKKEDSENINVDNGGENRIKPGLKKYACKLTLEPNTAQARLHLKEGNEKVIRERKTHSGPNYPERFSDWPQVLCKESLTGRCYWETEWEGRDVNVSVAYKSMERKGRSEKSAFGRNEKSWSLICSNNSYSVRHNNITTDLPRPPSGSKRVGVYVDYEDGILSFYSVSTDTYTHIYTFTTTFTEDLYAGFWVYYDCSVTLCKME